MGCCENRICVTRYIKHLAQSTCSVNRMKWNWEMTMETWRILTRPRSDIPTLEGCALGVDLPTALNPSQAHPESGQAAQETTPGFFTCLYLLCYNFQILFIRDPEHLKACVTHCTESKDQKSTGLTQGVTWCFPKTYLVTSSGSDSTVGLNSTTVIRIRSKRREISDH